MTQPNNYVLEALPIKSNASLVRDFSCKQINFIRQLFYQTELYTAPQSSRVPFVRLDELCVDAPLHIHDDYRVVQLLRFEVAIHLYLVVWRN
jgi:hypothetical protein